MVIARSAEGKVDCVILCVLELFEVSGSVKEAPPGMTMFAVLEMVPVAPDETVPLSVMVILLPAPALMDAPVRLTVLPVRLLVPQLAVPVTVQESILTPVIVVGTLSIILNPEAFPVPLLVTSIVYVMPPPDVYIPPLLPVLVITRSAEGS